MYLYTKKVKNRITQLINFIGVVRSYGSMRSVQVWGKVVYETAVLHLDHEVHIKLVREWVAYKTEPMGQFNKP